jgi:hypothetical protein
MAQQSMATGSFLGRHTFVSIPELDEDLDSRGGGREVPLFGASPPLKAPSQASRALAHAMAKAVLKSTASRSRGSNATVSAPPIRTAASLGDGSARNRSDDDSALGGATTGAGGVGGMAGDPMVTPRGGESEVLARFDYDTSTTLTQFSDAERHPQGNALDGLEGVPPPGEGLEPCRSGAWSCSSGGVATAVLSPRDKSTRGV